MFIISGETKLGRNKTKLKISLQKIFKSETVLRYNIISQKYLRDHSAYCSRHLGFERRYRCSGLLKCCLFYWTDAGQEIDFELVIEADEPAHIEETIFCDLKHSSAPVYVYVKASFEVSTQCIRYQKLICLLGRRGGRGGARQTGGDARRKN